MSSRVPGPTAVDGVCRVDPGTLARTRSPTPGPVGRTSDVGRWPVEERFRRVLSLTGPKLPAEIRDEFRALMTPANVAVAVGVLAAWAASHYFGVGFVADVVLLVAGGILVGWQVFSAANDLYRCVTITWSAATEADLDRAATHLANFIAVVGVAAFLAIVAKGAKGAKGRVANPGRLIGTRSYYMKVLGWSEKPDGVLRKLDDAVGFFTRNGDEIRTFEGGLSQSKMNEYVKGIDFSDTVLVRRINGASTTRAVQGSGDRKLTLIQYTDQYQTNFFTVPGTSPGRLAIPKFDEKKFRVYEVVGDVEVLVTRTAPVGPNLAGGAYQVIVPDPARHLRLVRQGLE